MDATPAATASAEVPPSIGVPTGVPSPPSIPESGAIYTAGADDLAAFIDAYRSAFPQADLDDAAIAQAGSRLCTYLMRHADTAGAVGLADALVEADVNEPGYLREDWVRALEVANAHYCREFTVDFESLGG